MLYVELTPAESQAESLEYAFKKRFQQRGSVEALFAFIEEKALVELKQKVAALSTASNQSIEFQYLKVKQELSDMRVRLQLISNVLREISPILKPPQGTQERLDKSLKDCQSLLTKTQRFKDQVIIARKKRLIPRFDQQMEQAWQQIQQLVMQKVKGEVPEEEQKMRALFVESNAVILDSIMAFFHENLDLWEQAVVYEGQGLLFTDRSKWPFNIIYAVDGTIFITLEVAGHFLGIGTGKIGTRAIEVQTGKILALAKLRTTFPEAKDRADEERLRKDKFYGAYRESEFLLTLRGVPGVLHLHNRFVFLEGGKKTLFLIEDYFADGTLGDYLEEVVAEGSKKEKFSSMQKEQIASELLQGLAAVHEKGIIHCDIKPTNILLDLHSSDPLKAVLCDFNLACHIDDKEERGCPRTTPYWSAPECTKLSLETASREKWVEANTFKADVWSLGVVFYCLLFDRFPAWNRKKDKQTEEDLLLKSQKGWATAEHPDHSWAPLLEGMLESDPHKRLSAKEALATLKKKTPARRGESFSR